MNDWMSKYKRAGAFLFIPLLKLKETKNEIHKYKLNWIDRKQKQQQPKNSSSSSFSSYVLTKINFKPLLLLLLPCALYVKQKKHEWIVCVCVCGTF